MFSLVASGDLEYRGTSCVVVFIASEGWECVFSLWEHCICFFMFFWLMLWYSLSIRENVIPLGLQMGDLGYSCDVEFMACS